MLTVASHKAGASLERLCHRQGYKTLYGLQPLVLFWMHTTEYMRWMMVRRGSNMDE